MRNMKLVMLTKKHANIPSMKSTDLLPLLLVLVLLLLR